MSATVLEGVGVCRIASKAAPRRRRQSRQPSDQRQRAAGPILALNR